MPSPFKTGHLTDSMAEGFRADAAKKAEMQRRLVADAILKALIHQTNGNIYFHATPGIPMKDISMIPSNSKTMVLQAHGKNYGTTNAPDSAILRDQDSEEEQAFMFLKDLARVLAQQTNQVHNLYDARCYSGNCDPASYKQVFPNLTNVWQSKKYWPTSALDIGPALSGALPAGPVEMFYPNRSFLQNGKWVTQPATNSVYPKIK